jgi:hypothetical protein
MLIICDNGRKKDLYDEYTHTSEKFIIYQPLVITPAILSNYFKMLKRQIYLKQDFQICRNSIKNLDG